jgi:DNA-binding transcriptional LysR family regulator
MAWMYVCEKQLSLEQSEPAGILRVNLPVVYGQLYVMPMMARFCKLYPEIKLDISLTDDYIDMVSHSIDVVTCASPGFLSNTKKVTNSNIAKQPWILYRFLYTGKIMPVYGIHGAGKNKKRYELTPEAALITTDGLSMATACQSGLGLLQAPHFLLREAVLSGSLELVQSFYRSEDFSVYAYYSHKDYMPVKIRVFLDYIVNELKAIGEDCKTTFLSK